MTQQAIAQKALSTQRSAVGTQPLGTFSLLSANPLPYGCVIPSPAFSPAGRGISPAVAASAVRARSFAPPEKRLRSGGRSKQSHKKHSALSAQPSAPSTQPLGTFSLLSANPLPYGCVIPSPAFSPAGRGISPAVAASAVRARSFAPPENRLCSDVMKTKKACLQG